MMIYLILILVMVMFSLYLIYVLEMKLVPHVMGRTPGTFPLERCELFDWLRKRHER